eukprot:SM000053S17492  [mRNA]  locus=s53:737290:737847:- [translate_table: standard]
MALSTGFARGVGDGHGGSSVLAALEGSYIMQAAVGRVECNSKGCRPIYDDDDDQSPAPSGCADSPWQSAMEGADELESKRAAYQTRCAVRDAEVGGAHPYSVDYALFLNEVWQEKASAENHFEGAIRRSPFDARLLLGYAHFCWKTLGDATKAEHMYRRAMKEAPDSAEVLASYALFLWQSESDC